MKPEVNTYQMVYRNRRKKFWWLSLNWQYLARCTLWFSLVAAKDTKLILHQFTGFQHKGFIQQDLFVLHLIFQCEHGISWVRGWDLWSLEQGCPDMNWSLPEYLSNLHLCNSFTMSAQNFTSIIMWLLPIRRKVEVLQIPPWHC